MTERSTVSSWLDGYGAAWSAHDGGAAASLFTEDAEYHWGPFEEPLVGRAAIAARWHEATRAHGDVRFWADVLAVDGDRATVRWWVHLDGPGVALDGTFVLDFEVDGRCRRLQEWWMAAPAPVDAADEPAPESRAFDFTAFRDAFAAKDRDAWLRWYAEDATWTEVRAADPPRAPHVMRGRARIAEHLTMVCGAPIALELSNEVVGPDRAAFTVTATRPDGTHILENVIVDLDAGRIVRQLDVEAWD